MTPCEVFWAKIFGFLSNPCKSPLFPIICFPKFMCVHTVQQVSLPTVTHTPETMMWLFQVLDVFHFWYLWNLLTLRRPCRSREAGLNSEDARISTPARECSAHLEKPPRGLGLDSRHPQIGPRSRFSRLHSERSFESSCCEGRMQEKTCVQCK